MRSRPLLLFVLLLCTGYAASTSAYADEAVPYWDDQVLQVPETTSPLALCTSAFALAATLLLHRKGRPQQRRKDRAAPRRKRRAPPREREFDSETLVLSRSQW